MDITTSSTDMSGRPSVITALCGFYFVTVGLSILKFLLSIFSALTYKISFAQMGMSGTVLLQAVGLPLLVVAAVYGYWMMQKWGVYLFLVTFLVLGALQYHANPMMFSAGAFAVISGLLLEFLVPLFTIWVGFRYLRAMR